MIGRKRNREENYKKLTQIDLTHLDKLEKSERSDSNQIIEENTSIFLSKIQNNEKIKCNICKTDLTMNMIIITDIKDTIYCFNCLIVSDEIEDEFNYVIPRKINFNVFTPNWVIEEELSLLNGLEKFGLDNWPDISEYISTKSAIECQAHYYTFYYKSSLNIIPQESDLIYSDDCSLNNLKNNYNQNLEKSLIDKISKNQGIDQKKPNKDNIIDQASIDRMVTRAEFDIEYLNNAELKLADLEFYEDDTEDEKKIKYEFLKQYNLLIEERERRKQFVIDRKLYCLKSILAERKLDYKEKEIYNAIKPFNKYLGQKKFKSLFDGLLTEHTLNKKNFYLKMLKDNNITTYKSINQSLDQLKNSSEKLNPYLKKKKFLSFYGRLKSNKLNKDRSPADIEKKNEKLRLVFKKNKSSKHFVNLIKKRIAKDLLAEQNTNSNTNTNNLSDNFEDYIDYHIKVNNKNVNLN